jgi:hypothetical protein
LPGEFILIFVLGIGVVIAIAVLGHAKEKRRREALANWASSKQMYFHVDRVYGFDDQHPELAFLGQGSNRYAYNIVSGSWGPYEATAFDYHYETYSNDSKGNRQTHHHYFSVLLLQPDFPLQRLQIRKEGIFDKLKSTFGFKDINFESAEFSRRFFVMAEDRKWAYDVIHTRTMEVLMRNVDFAIECDHQVMAIYQDRKMEIVQFEHAYHLGSEVLEGIPNHARENTRLRQRHG